MSSTLDAYRSGSTEPWTVDIIAAIVRAKRPYVVLETGAYLGLTTKAIFEAMTTYSDEHGGELTTVEFDPERSRAAFELAGTWCSPQSNIRIRVVQGDALLYIADMKDDSVDLVFLDDDHTAEHVTAELVALRPKMRPGGIVLMHDVVGPFGLDVVCRHAGGVVLDLPRLHAAGGLGVICK